MIGPLDIPHAIGWRWPVGPLMMFFFAFAG